MSKKYLLGFGTKYSENAIASLIIVVAMVVSLALPYAPAYVRAEEADAPVVETTSEPTPEPTPEPAPSGTEGTDGTSGTTEPAPQEDVNINTGDATAVVDATNTANINEVDTTTRDREASRTEEATTTAPDTTTPPGDATETATSTDAGTGSTADTSADTATSTESSRPRPSDQTDPSGTNNSGTDGTGGTDGSDGSSEGADGEGGGTTTSTSTDPEIAGESSSGAAGGGASETVSEEPLICQAPAGEEVQGGTERDTSGRYRSLDVNNNNAACVDNTIAGGATTGDNTAGAPNGNANINTGNANIFVNLVNFINANFINSNVFTKFLNSFSDSYGSVELDFGAPKPCMEFGCELTDISITNTNNALVNNAIDILAATGSNTATGEGANIVTGDAHAGANVVNFVNTNVINSSFLAFVYNSFGSWFGDLILPTAADLFGPQQCPTCTNGSLSVTNTNNADVNNGIGVEADSGNNTATSTDGASNINTGNAVANANLMTIANMNLMGSNSILLFLHTGGNWTGKIFGLPDGVKVINTPNGILIDSFGIFDEIAMGPQPLSPEEERAQSRGRKQTLEITNDNTAIVNNAISVRALTGDNTASSTDGSTISTGDAYAAANVANLVNANVIGMNWLLAMINVFGDWEGDISFGQPNLWIGGTADAPHAPLMKGDVVEVTYTYRNNGNSPATGVVLEDRVSEHLRITDSRGGTVDGYHIRFNIPRIDPNQDGTVSYLAQVLENIPYGTLGVNNVATIDPLEPEATMEDNTEHLSLEISNPAPVISGGGGGGGGSGSSNNGGSRSSYSSASSSGGTANGSTSGSPKLSLTKKRETVGDINPGDRVDYQVVVENNGNASALAVNVTDVMTDEHGNTVNIQQWDLGEVFAGEQILLDYTVEFSTSSPFGVYINTATLEGKTASGTMLRASSTSVASLVVKGPVEDAIALASASVEGDNLANAKALLNGFTNPLGIEEAEASPSAPVAAAALAPVIGGWDLMWLLLALLALMGGYRLRRMIVA